MKICKFIIFIGTIAKCYAAPTIGIPDLIYTKEISTPINYTRSIDNIASESYNHRKYTYTSINTQVISQVDASMPMFSSTIRGTIIKGKQFTVVDANPTIKAWTNNKKDILDIINRNDEISDKSSTIAMVIESSPTKTQSAITSNKQIESTSNNVINQPQYMLIGYLNNIDAYENRTPIKDTDKTSAIYNIDVNVDYKLIDTQKKEIIASFTAIGHGGQVKLLNDPDQKVNYNISQIIKECSNSLAQDVISNLDTQVNYTKINPKPQVAPLTNIKVYD